MDNNKSTTSGVNAAGSSRASGRFSVSKGSSTAVNKSEVTITFEKLLPFIVKKYALDFDIIVNRSCVTDEKKASSKPARIRPSSGSHADQTKLERRATVFERPRKSTLICPNIFEMTALYNNRGSFVEISIQNRRDIPSMLFTIIIIMAPSFPSLSKVSIRNCVVTNNIILDLNKLQSLNKLTAITLDDSYLYGRNFEILLNQESFLKNLSLNRCNIRDEGCKEISIKLKYPNTAERNLVFLSLSGNKITDVGVQYLAEMLRTNRCLRYLNLASNQITDDGVRHLLEILIEFPLNEDELMAKKYLLVNYLSKLRPLLKNSVKENHSSVSSPNRKIAAISKKRCPKAKFQIEDSDGKVRLIVKQILEQYRDPFGEDSIIRRGDSWYCRGNDILCYLNLAYNDLSLISVKNIADFLQHKSETDSADLDFIKFCLEGNNLPTTSKDLARIDSYYQSRLNLYHSRVSVRRSRRSTSIKIKLNS